MSDTSAATGTGTSRRRLLAWLGAGGAAALATLFTRETAKAGHDGTNTFHLGESNAASASTTIETTVNDEPAFAVTNAPGYQSESGVIKGMHSGPDFGVGVEGIAEVEGPSGIGVRGRGGHVGVIGEASEGEAGVKGLGGRIDDVGTVSGAAAGVVGKSFTSVGVRGETESPDQPAILGEGRTAIEREGELGSAPGVVGRSGSGTGVRGESVTGTGGEFASESGYALRAEGQTHVGGSAEGFALGVDNEATGETAGGILAVSRGGKPAVEGDAIPSEHHGGIGVQGVSGYDETFGSGPGIGVQGISGTGVGVDAISADGLALRVQGRAAFSTVGSGAVPSGEDSTFVPSSAVTADSHVAVTLVGNPGRRDVRWVERSAGAGFTVHLSPGTPRDPEVPFTYGITEPA